MSHQPSIECRVVINRLLEGAAVFAAAVFILTLTSLAQAKDLPDADGAELADIVARYEAAFLERNHWAIGAAMPPRVLEQYVASRGALDMERELWIALFVADSEELDRQLGSVIEAFALDLANARAEETSDGTPYVVIPSTTVVQARTGERVRISSPYVALLDDGTWYLLNVGLGGPNLSIEEAYPSFEGIEFGFATHELL
ncbi:MAG: hypothetical protein AAF414_20380 [Pseudomonadota bacterium]